MYQFINEKKKNQWAMDGHLVFGNNQKLMSHMRDLIVFLHMVE